MPLIFGIDHVNLLIDDDPTALDRAELGDPAPSRVSGRERR